MATRRAASTGGRSPAGAAARGAGLIVLAVLIGVALLAWGFSEEDGLIDAGGTTTTPPGTVDDGDDPDTTSPDTTDATDPDDDDEEPGLPPSRTREEITVLVMNGSGVNGAAGRVRQHLLGLNYTPRAPETAPQRAENTTIYYIADHRPEALRMAADLNVEAPSDVIAEMPDPVPMNADLAENTSILIILGEDELIGVAAG